MKQNLPPEEELFKELIANIVAKPKVEKPTPTTFNQTNKTTSSTFKEEADYYAKLWEKAFWDDIANEHLKNASERLAFRLVEKVEVDKQLKRLLAHKAKHGHNYSTQLLSTVHQKILDLYQCKIDNVKKDYIDEFLIITSKANLLKNEKNNRL